MIVIFILILVAVAAGTTKILHRYISFKKTPLYVYLTSWIGWYMCFGIIVLVPIDILSTKYRDCMDKNNNNTDICENAPLSMVSVQVLYYFYNIFYFGTLVLTWLVYPLLGSFVLAGDFKLTERIQRSIRENVYLYLVFLVIGIVIVVWLLAFKRLDWSSMLGYLIAAANTWGIILVIVLMGYGLVETPRNIWISANRQIVLRHLQFKISSLQHQKKKSSDELLATLKQVKKISDKTRPHDPYEKYVRIIIDQCPPELYSTIQYGEGTGEITYSTLVSLNSKLKNAVQDANRSESLYNQCIDEAYELEDILSSGGNIDKVIHWSFKDARTGRFASQIDRLEWIWFTYLEVPFLRLLALLFVICSAILVWSEISVAIKDTDVSILSNIVKHTDVNNLGIQIVLFFPLGYAALVTYSTLFKIRIFNYYRLISGQHSDSNSIIFSAAYLCRLAAPLCYNFITFIKVESTFANVMGSANFVPFLGQKFYLYFPIVIVIVVLATAFNLYSRIMNCLNISRFRFDEDFSHENIDEGKMILEHEKRRREVAKKTAAIDRSNPWSNNNRPTSLTTSNDKRYTLLRNTLDDEFDDDLESGSNSIDIYNGGGNGRLNSSTTPPMSDSPNNGRLKSSLNGFPSLGAIFGRDRDKLIRK